MTCERFLTLGAASSVSRPTRGPERQRRAAEVQVEPAGDLGVLALGDPVVEREDVVLLGLALEDLLELAQPVGVLGGEVARLAPVGGVVVELPDVLVERALGVSTISHGTPWRVTAVQPSW